MHGRPFSPHDNRRLWEKSNFEDFGILGECYLSINYQKLTYFSDTGRTWDPHRYNLRDKVSQNQLPAIDRTDDLIAFLTSNQLNHICILTHPNRWPASTAGWMLSAFSDFIINRGKKILIASRSPG